MAFINDDVLNSTAVLCRLSHYFNGRHLAREGRKDRCRKRERVMWSLPSPHFRFMQLSQMAVFSCMRLEDVSDSRCCFLGKLIFQAKLFLFWWSTEVRCGKCVLDSSKSSSVCQGEGKNT